MSKIYRIFNSLRLLGEGEAGEGQGRIFLNLALTTNNRLNWSFQIEMKHVLQVIWFNLRVEPVGYVDGLPVAARAPEALHTNIQVGQRSKRQL